MAIIYQKNKASGVTYVYESISHWDKQKKQSRAKRECIGKLDLDTGEVVPCRPKSKPSPKTDEPSLPLRGRPPSTQTRRLFCGATSFLNQIGSSLGIDEDLKKCFPKCYTQILSIAYYLILESCSTMARFSKWSKTRVHPYGQQLESQRISELFQSIDESKKLKFFKLQALRRMEHEYLAYDTTSISSYSKQLKLAKRGKNKEHDPLAQINLALLFGENSRLPVYYRKLPGNIQDVSTVQHLLKDLDFLNIKKLKMVFDRGFYSEKNINGLYKTNKKFIIGAKRNLKIVQKHLTQAQSVLPSRAYYDARHEVYSYTAKTTWTHNNISPRTGATKVKKHLLYVHVYYNDIKAAEDRTEFNNMLDMLEYELMNNQRKSSHEESYEKYYDVSSTPVRGVKLLPKQDAIDEAQKQFGYFILLSNGVKDSVEALAIYRAKDLVEKAFGNLKERLNMRRQFVSSNESLDGKLFVQFIALIYSSYIHKIMNEQELYKKYTMQGLLDELDIIERHEYEGYQPVVSEISKSQREIMEWFGVQEIS